MDANIPIISTFSKSSTARRVRLVILEDIQVSFSSERKGERQSERERAKEEGAER